MKIHVYSRSFAPALGGLERLMGTLAAEFQNAGYELVVVTETEGEADLDYPVIRRPGFMRYLRSCRSADVIVTAPLSLRRLLPQILSRRRIFAVHPDVLKGYNAKQHVAAAIKRTICRLVTNIVPSRYMAAHFPRPVVILNPYDESTFGFPDPAVRRQGILFVGRLVPRKGCCLLVDAFSRAARERPEARLTIVGDGSERAAIAAQIARAGLDDRITLAGTFSGKELARVMQRHAIMVVPSITEEPFGIVALEGLASGCRMIVSRAGGLPEAVGPHALQFERGNVDGLAQMLIAALDTYEPPDETEISCYLAQFRPAAIARQYLDVLDGDLRP
jgi:glycosyltransferase involved in cell wall biosynthesis